METYIYKFRKNLGTCEKCGIGELYSTIYSENIDVAKSDKFEEADLVECTNCDFEETKYLDVFWWELYEKKFEVIPFELVKNKDLSIEERIACVSILFMLDGSGYVEVEKAYLQLIDILGITDGNAHFIIHSITEKGYLKMEDINGVDVFSVHINSNF